MSKKQRLNLGIMAWWLPLFAGMVITLITALALQHQNEIDLRSYTNTLADKAESAIKMRFQSFEDGLRATRGAIAAVGVDNMSADQFENYINSRDIKQEFPGALGFGFIRRVSAAQEASFLALASTDAASNFSIRALAPHDSDRFVIQYILPSDDNQQAIGLDIGSETNRRNAAIASARSNQPQLTTPITLVQENNKPRRGVLILLPIYPNGLLLQTPEAREQAVLGWAYAPLVIDDVLSNLSGVMEQASITLSNTAELEPFFHSANTVRNDLFEGKIVRNIFVLGQQWRMEITPNIKASQGVIRWDISWVIALGLSLTSLVLLVFAVLRSSAAIEELDNNEGANNGIIGILPYLQSPLFKRTLAPILTTMLLIFTISSWFIVQNHLGIVKSILVNSNTLATGIINKKATEYRQSVIFLAKTPPIISLINQFGSDSGTNPINSEQLRERLAEIFKAYMLATPEVHQVRLLDASKDWQEVVKVQRFNDTLHKFNDRLLQNKKNEPYIASTLKVGDNNVYISEVNLNREFGSIEYPERPTWRFSTPLFNHDGSPFGIIIININAEQILKEAALSAPMGTNIYITNTNHEFLLHPNTSRAFNFERGLSYTWEDEFKAATWWSYIDSFNLQSFRNMQGRVWVEQKDFYLDDTPSNRALSIYSVSHQHPTFKSVASQIAVVFIVLAILFLLIVAFLYWGWMNKKTRERNAWQAHMQTQRSKETMRFKSLLESTPDAILIVNEAGIIQLVNAQAERVFGYARSNLEGQSIEKLIPNDLKEAQLSYVISHMQADRPLEHNKQLFALAADGSEFPIEVSFSSVILDEERLVSASVRDITERLDIEEKLRDALQTAEQATAAKSAFLANTSHEIRTPLNAIIGLTYLLTEEELTEKQHLLVEKIYISGNSLLGIVNDVLDLSKIEANEMTLEALPVELRELLEEVAGIFSIQAEAKRLQFALELDPQLPAWTVTDGMRIRQVLVNLLNNALKFTSLGQITLRAEVISNPVTPQESHTTVRFTVIDTGIGISPEAQARLFKPFSQADSTTTRQYGGTGLGLSIVRNLVNLMDGDIGIESSTNNGSKFWVDIPLLVQTQEDITRLENENPALLVLIAEDDEDDAKHLQKMAQALGWRAMAVHDGAELVDIVISRRDQKMRMPDALLVDWQMPSMDGLNAIRTLATKIGREQLPAILMVSAYDREHISALDIDNLVGSFLHKPVHASTLFNAVNDVVTFHTGNTRRVLELTRTEAVKAKWLSGMQVLVVDDSATNLMVATHILERNGAIVHTAINGEEALAKIKESPDLYDSVLMDIQMPVMDGLEATRRVREQLKLPTLPIIALTAGALLEERKRALSAGMNDFLTKPIDPSKLINVVRASVEEYRGVNPPIETSSQDEASQNDWPHIDGLNQAQAKRLLLGDKKLFLNTLDSLLQQHANLTTAPAENIDAPESEKLRLQLAAQVHKLRSAAGMVGAENLQQLAADAENLIRNTQQPTYELLSALASELRTLQNASTAVLLAWKNVAALRSESTLKNTTPLIQEKVVQHLIALLKKQDLAVMDEVEQYKNELTTALGNDQFNQLTACLMQLNYQQAITILEPLSKDTGDAL